MLTISQLDYVSLDIIHMVSMRWLANTNWECNYFLHNVWSSYKCLIYYQHEHSLSPFPSTIIQSRQNHFCYSPSILIHRVPKAVKFHTCSRHILTWWKKLWSFRHVTITSSMMEKVSWKDTNSGSLKRAQLVLKFRLPFIRNKSTCAVNMCWKRILPLKNYDNFKTWK